MYKKLLLIVPLLLSTGCASSLHEFHNRAVVEDNIEDAVGTLSLNAQRRTVIVALDGENRGKFCAEPPPDVAESVTTSLEAALKATIKETDTDVSGSLKDTLETQITVLGERTTILDVYRTGTYALCQYHLNGAMGAKELQESFDSLTQQVLDKMGSESVKSEQP